MSIHPTKKQSDYFRDALMTQYVHCTCTVSQIRVCFTSHTATIGFLMELLSS